MGSSEVARIGEHEHQPKRERKRWFVLKEVAVAKGRLYLFCDVVATAAASRRACQ